MTPRPGSDNPERDQTGQTPSDPTPTSDGVAVERIIERFGGIRPMAHKLDTPVTTVQGWKKRGAIPLSRHADLRAAAVKFGIPLDEADLEAATPAEDRSADARAARADETVAGGAAETPAAVSDDGEPGAAGEPATVRAADDRAGTGTADAGSGEAERPFSPPVRVVTEDRPSGGAGFATFVALVALVVGVAALTDGWWGRYVPGWDGEPEPVAAPQPDPALRDELSRLTQRLDALEQRPAAEAGGGAPEVQALVDRVAALEQRTAAPGEPPAGGDGGAAADLQSLAERVAALENQPETPAEPPQDPRIDPLSQRVASLGETVTTLERQLSAAEADGAATQQLQQRLAALGQEVDRLSGQVQARGDRESRAQALVLASGQLRGALSSDRPFQAELEAVRTLAGSDGEVAGALDAVAPHAGQGIPTRSQLAERFEPLGSRIVRADLEGEGGSWVDQVKGTLSTLVTVRRQGGGVVGNGAEAVVARAEAAVNDGNLAGAVDELAALKGPAAEAAADWVAAAKARLAADAALRTLDGRALALLKQTAGAAGGAGAQ
ncbi:COG4223 family protein [Azospirillum sp. ST 5-10]|uniref:COG4223 family protein n=1 Tax=unclassified Azospirillum TaxID=2630922 RepID=UPI003F4A029E